MPLPNMVQVRRSLLPSGDLNLNAEIGNWLDIPEDVGLALVWPCTISPIAPRLFLSDLFGNLRVASSGASGSTPQTQTSGANATNTVVIAASPNQVNYLTLLEAHLSAAGTATLTVSIGGTTVLSIPITTAAMQALVLPHGGLIAPPNTDITVAVSAAGMGVTSTLNLASITQ